MTLFKRLVPAVFAVLAVVGPARALDIDVTSFKLDNGMQVVVIPDHRAPVVTHMVWYKTGAADEAQGKAGIAHLLEHLMFKGTPKYPDGAFSRIVRANGGSENAFTTQDYTAYFQKVMKDRLPLVMELEADRMQNLQLTDETVLPERSVVLEERRQRTDNEPAGLLHEQMGAAMYTAHPYGKPIIGWMPQVSQLTRQDAMDFYAAHYEPENAILIVAGDVTPEEVKTLAERYYGPLRNKRPVTERVRAEEPPPNAERRITMSDPRVSAPSLQRQYLTPAARNLPQREELAMSLLAEIIGGSNQSRFYQTLNLGKKLAAYSGAWFDADQLDYGEFGVYASPNPGVTVEAVEKEIDAILDEVATRGVTQEELDRSRNNMIASAVYLLDSQDKLARMFGVSLATGQTIDDVLNWDKDLATVTVEDVNNAARRVLNRRASVTGVLLPEAQSQ
ncbi:insulinase family protein [Aestuariivirga litoralis]|uniref:Insulinase family protein n=1 Tax=Aestuariivirga litoralis TaxID=2650924 RepID=A0A2W2AYL6_9HYPH|nr:pitrilysin family protein [Aestuariivirga litoralis]PZF77700.1 insulinase family protein [Aestuariivirga litoralis]